MRRLLPILAAALAFGACGGGDDDDGPQTLAPKVRLDPNGVLQTQVLSCDVADGRQLRATGTVENTGERPYNVQLSVRFIDGDGTRVEIASDSVTDLERGESARWDASTYSDVAGDARTCEVSARGT